MVKKLEFYFDVASPPSYIAHRRLPALVERTGAALILKPVLVGGVFKLSGNAAPVSVPAKKAYMMRVELPCLARQCGIALDFDSRAPFDSLNLMRGAVVADELGGLAEYATALFRATWATARDMSDPTAVADVLDAAGFDPGVIFTRIRERTIKDRLIAATEAAVDRGVFGVPTFFIGTEMYFGQDRLDVIETELGAASP